MEILMVVFPFLFIGVFVCVFGMVIFTFIRSFGQWNKNNKSPRLTVHAKVVSKRMQFSTNRSTNTHHASTHTAYYVTFEVESGDRFELNVQGMQYGMLIEGDCGKLTFQGTRFLNFERT